MAPPRRAPARIALAALLGCAVAAWARPAAALSWARFTYARDQGAESCPDETALRAAVTARLGYEPFVPTADRTIIAIVGRERRMLRASVQLVDQAGVISGVRRLEAPLDQCRELAAAMALAISVAVDPSRAQADEVDPLPIDAPAPAAPDDEQPQAAPPAPVGAAPPPAQAGEVRAQLAPPPPSPSIFRVAADVTSARGAGPALSFGVALSAGLRRRAASLAVEGRYDLPTSLSVASGGEVRASLWLASLVGCAHLRTFFGCAVASAGALRGEGVALPSSRSGIGFYSSAGARVGAEIPLRGRWFLRPRLDVLAALARPALQVDGATAWTAPILSVVGGIGVGLQIP